MKFRFQINLMCFLVIIFITLGCNPALADRTHYDWALIQLDFIRQEKVAQLERFMQRIHNLAQDASEDQTIISFFEMNRHYNNAKKLQNPPVSFTADVEKMRQHFNEYYIANYFIFYDILFVDMEGIVFHTLRKEMDNNINLIENKTSLGLLSEAISREPENEVFIDFYDYGPSSEPAAFFIEPVFKNNVKVGWIILQCPINKLNSIFSATDDLGQTGETFLVNKQGLMLTESYFKGQSTILKERLDDRNIKVKFQEKKGHRIVTDYRGEKALSSFEVFEFLDTNWLVVAKIDKDEVTTDSYKHHSKYYGKMLFKYFNTAPLSFLNKHIPNIHSTTIRVDMDEFLKAQNKEILETWGVSTCTALIAAIPKKFGYLGHISPKDRVYNKDDTNLLSQITKKIKSFDIYPCERRECIFIVVANHLDSLINVLDQLIQDGFLLSQIRVSYNKNAKSANVIYSYDNNYLTVKWKTMSQEPHDTNIQNFRDTVNVGHVIEGIMLNEKNNQRFLQQL